MKNNTLFWQLWVVIILLNVFTLNILSTRPRLFQPFQDAHLKHLAQSSFRLITTQKMVTECSTVMKTSLHQGAAAMDDCTGIPQGGIVSVSPSSGSPGGTYTVSSTGYSEGAGGLYYMWYYSTDGGTTWQFYDSYETYTPITVSAPNNSAEVKWKLVVYCLGSDSYGYSSIATYTITNNCPDTLTLVSPVNDVASGDSKTHKGVKITASHKVKNNGVGNLIAVNNIEFLPGFEVSPGAVFTAKIDNECGNL